MWGIFLKNQMFQNIGANITTRRQTQQTNFKIGPRDNLTSCCTLNVFLRMPNDWIDTYKVSDGKVFRSTIMEEDEQKI